LQHRFQGFIFKYLLFRELSLQTDSATGVFLHLLGLQSKTCQYHQHLLSWQHNSESCYSRKTKSYKELITATGLKYISHYSSEFLDMMVGMIVNAINCIKILWDNYVFP